MDQEERERSTALELGRRGWQHYLVAARHRPSPPPMTAAEQQGRQEVIERVREAAVVMKARFGIQRVVLFGSLAHAAWFSPEADVDLAVEGLCAEDFWRAWQVAEEIIATRSVDLVDLETAGESVRQAIQRHGIEL